VENIHVIRKVYHVKVAKVKVGKASSLAEARRMRDDYIKRTGGVKRCATCGRLPEIFRPGKAPNSILRHLDCENACESVRAPVNAIVARWNQRLYRRHRDGLTIVAEDGLVPEQVFARRARLAARKQTTKPTTQNDKP
jgi:hypothetical protein